MPLPDKIADVEAKKRKEEDVLSDISERESISSTLPSKRNANREILIKEKEKPIQVTKERNLENHPFKTTSRSHMTTTRSPVKESRVESMRDPSRDRHGDSPQKSSSSYYRPRPRSDRTYQEIRGRSKDKFDRYGPQKKDYAYSYKPRYREDHYVKPTTSERETIERERKALEDEMTAFKKEQEVAAKERRRRLFQNPYVQ